MTSQNLNPDVYGKPSPISVNIFELSSSYPFTDKTYQELSQEIGQSLGNSLIDKHQFILRPNSQQKITLPLSKNIQFLGLTADYRLIDQVIWKKIITWPPFSNTLALTIQLNPSGLTSTSAKKRSLWRKIIGI